MQIRFSNSIGAGLTALVVLAGTACVPKPPAGAKEIHLTPVTRKGVGVVSQFEATGRAGGFPHLYWLYLPEDKVGRLYLKVSSTDGSASLVRQTNLAVGNHPGELCVSQSDTPTECDLDVNQPKKGEYFFLVYSRSQQETDYRLFVGSAFRDL